MMPSEQEEALEFLKERLQRRRESAESIERRLADAVGQIHATYREGAIRTLINNGAILFKINSDEDVYKVIGHLLAEVNYETYEWKQLPLK